MTGNLNAMRRPLIKGSIFFCCLFLTATRAAAQNTETLPWYKSIYIEAGGLVDLLPKQFLGDIKGEIKPMFGFHGALGYELRRFRLSLSSGYSQSSETDQFVDNISFIPLTGRVGYALPIKDNWGAEAYLGFGFQFSNTFHYETALDFWAGRRSESLKIKPLIEGRLRATYAFSGEFLKAYAGGGADIVFETDKPIPLPMIELGISLKPLALNLPPKKHKERTPVPKPVTEPEEPYLEPTPEPEPEPELEKPYQEPEPEPYQEPEPEPEPGIRLSETQDKDGGKDIRRILYQKAIYFEADRGTRVLAQSWPLLVEAGRILQANPKASVILRGYAALFGTTEGQWTISAARVWFCVEYLKWECGIAEERIEMEYFGAEDVPVSEEAEWQLRRRVELVIIE
jgi:outer membrane protein OmpA-like peptidoglycan-associated protein